MSAKSPGGNKLGALEKQKSDCSWCGASERKRVGDEDCPVVAVRYMAKKSRDT